MHFFLDYKPKEHWQDLSNCRNFFDAYANEIGINPCHAASWDEIRMIDMAKRKVIDLSPNKPSNEHKGRAIDSRPSWRLASGDTEGLPRSVFPQLVNGRSSCCSKLQGGGWCKIRRRSDGSLGLFLLYLEINHQTTFGTLTNK